MAAGVLLPPKKYIASFDDWSLATGQAEQSESVQVATLRSCIGGAAWKFFATFTFDVEDERKKVTPVNFWKLLS